jgi:hypothetical protein
MTFQPRHNLMGMNDLVVPHTRFPRNDISLDPEATERLQDLRDQFADGIDEACQWLYRMGKGFRYSADCDIDPRLAVEDIKQRIEEQFLAPIDQRLQDLADADTSPRPAVLARPGGHGCAP